MLLMQPGASQQTAFTEVALSPAKATAEERKSKAPSAEVQHSLPSKPGLPKQRLTCSGEDLSTPNRSSSLMRPPGPAGTIPSLHSRPAEEMPAPSTPIPHPKSTGAALQGAKSIIQITQPWSAGGDTGAGSSERSLNHKSCCIRHLEVTFVKISPT